MFGVAGPVFPNKRGPNYPTTKTAHPFVRTVVPVDGSDHVGSVVGIVAVVVVEIVLRYTDTGIWLTTLIIFRIVLAIRHRRCWGCHRSSWTNSTLLATHRSSHARTRVKVAAWASHGH
jgi:hypothetical protein